MPETTPTVAEILDAAATQLEEHGWRKYLFADELGRCCAAGAINLVAIGDAHASWAADERLTALTRQAKSLLLDTVGFDSATDEYNCIDDAVGEWNDRPLRHRDQVVTAMREAAARARLDASLSGPAPVDPAPMGGEHQ
jgi:hypothetical protein